MVLDRRQKNTARLAQSMIANQVEEAAADGNIGDVRAPHLVRPLDRQAAQQVGEYLVPRRRFAGARLRSERGNPQSYASAGGTRLRLMA